MPGLPPRLGVVEEDGAQFQVLSMKLPGEGGVVGTGERAPGGPVESSVSRTAFEHHAALHEPAVWQDLKADNHGAFLENWRIHLVGNEGVPCALGLAVPAQQPRAEVDALRVAEN